MPYAELDGACLYYEQHGDPEGSDVVFLHGAGGNHLSWWQQLPAFGERYRCTVYDARGWGRSLATGEHDRGAFGRDVAGLLEHLAIDSAHVIAQSMGGRAVAGLLRLAPERVRAHQAELREERGEGGLARYAIMPAFAAQHPELALLYHQIRRLNPAREANLLGPPPASYRGSTHELLMGSGLPIAFVVGEHDRITSPALIREARGLVPGASLFELVGAGHSTYFEQPQAFNDYVLRFLARAEAGRSGDERQGVLRSLPRARGSGRSHGRHRLIAG